jgi:hypothetical protein
MSEYDEYELAAGHRLQELNAAKMQTLANLEIYKSQGDVDGMGQEIERLGQIQTATQGIHNLASQHYQSKIPVQQYQPSKEELDARPAERCDWSDTYRMMAQSAKNPQELEAMNRKFQEGCAEVLAHPSAKRGG